LRNEPGADRTARPATKTRIVFSFLSDADLGTQPGPGRRGARGLRSPARARIARGPRGEGGRRPGPLLLAAWPGQHPALVNGAVGVVATLDGEPFSVGGFTVRGGKIVEMDVLADPERLRRLDLTILDG
jgi:hypothetical protein